MPRFSFRSFVRESAADTAFVGRGLLQLLVLAALVAGALTWPLQTVALCAVALIGWGLVSRGR